MGIVAKLLLELEYGFRLVYFSMRECVYVRFSGQDVGLRQGLIL